MQHVANLINSGYKKIMEKKVLTNYTSFNKCNPVRFSCWPGLSTVLGIKDFKV